MKKRKLIIVIIIFFNVLTVLSQNNIDGNLKNRYWSLSEKIIPQNDVIPQQKTDTIIFDNKDTEVIYLSNEFIRFYNLKNGNLEIIDSAIYDINNNTITYKEPNNRVVSIYTIKPKNKILYLEMQTRGGIYIKKYKLLNKNMNTQWKKQF